MPTNIKNYYFNLYELAEKNQSGDWKKISIFKNFSSIFYYITSDFQNNEEIEVVKKLLLIQKSNIFEQNKTTQCVFCICYQFYQRVEIKITTARRKLLAKNNVVKNELKVEVQNVFCSLEKMV